MPFNVSLVWTDHSPNRFERWLAIERIVSAGPTPCDPPDPAWSTIVVRVGGEADFTVSADGFSLIELTQQACATMFAVASGTQAGLVTYNGGGALLTPPGVAVRPQPHHPPAQPIADGEAVLSALLEPYQRWRKAWEDAGLWAVANAPSAGPSPDVGEEKRPADAPPDLDDRLAAFVLRGRGGQEILRMRTTVNPNWGLVWRGDVVLPDTQGVSRVMGWQPPDGPPNMAMFIGRVSDIVSPDTLAPLPPNDAP